MESFHLLNMCSEFKGLMSSCLQVHPSAQAVGEVCAGARGQHRPRSSCSRTTPASCEGAVLGLGGARTALLLQPPRGAAARPIPQPPPPLCPDQAQVSILPSTSSAQLPRPPPVVPRTTTYRRRKAAEAAAAAKGLVLPKQKRKQQQQQHYLCRKGNQPKRLDTGHTRIGGVTYCATFGGKSVEEWRKEVKDKEGTRHNHVLRNYYNYIIFIFILVDYYKLYIIL
ncbi:hypothetical protein GOODEAATRI_034612 [Goodea atripinnis]|uniref:Uncharacterized protein n=1 Tax=Goodea atripinnis TaxID=208336 RepID=A0ABV0N6J7_9TELE